MRIRQIALAARHLEPVVDHLCALFGLDVAFRDPGVGEFGLHNAVMPIGDQFLEVVSPFKESTAAGRFIGKRRGDTGYMVILQTDDLEADKRRLEAAKVRIVWQIAFDDIATVHLHPADLGGALVSLDQPRPPESWRWAGSAWQGKVRRDVVRRITSATLEALDPAAMAARWSVALGLDTPHPSGDGYELALDGGRLRFVYAGEHGEGLVAVGVDALDSHRTLTIARERGLRCVGHGVKIGGVRFEM